MMHSISINDLAGIILLAILFGVVQGGLLVYFINQRFLSHENTETEESPDEKEKKFKVDMKTMLESVTVVANPFRSLTYDPLAKPDPGRYVYQEDYSNQDGFKLYTGVYL